MAFQKFINQVPLDHMPGLRLIPDSVYDELAYGALKKHPSERSQIELQYMVKYFKKNQYFVNYDEDVIQQCCQHMNFEVLQQNQILYRRSELLDEEDKKLYLLVKGQLGIYLNKPKFIKQLNQQVDQIEIMTINKGDFFGSQLFILQKEDYFEIPGLVIKVKRETEVASIAKEFFSINMMQLEISRITNEITKLYAFPIFNQISYSLLRKFYVNSFKFDYTYMETVYQQGEQAEVVYLILDGIFEIKQYLDKDYKNLGLLARGELIGEQEIMHEQVNRQHSVVCSSERGTLLAFDSQFFKGYVYRMIQNNVGDLIEKKIRFHEMERLPIRKELKKLDSLCRTKATFKQIQKVDQMHYKMKPRRNSLDQQEEEQSYYSLYVQLFDYCKQSSNKAVNCDQKRRITHYVKKQQKQPQSKDSFNRMFKIPFKNESIRQAAKNDSELQPKMLSKKTLELELTHQRSPSFYIAQKYKSVEKLIKKQQLKDEKPYMKF
ncbi:Cyclic nucleotide-binding domain-containing protein 2 [Paramecium bursaria]